MNGRVVVAERNILPTCGLRRVPSFADEPAERLVVVVVAAVSFSCVPSPSLDPGVWLEDRPCHCGTKGSWTSKYPVIRLRRWIR